jgi:hypothetical protein
MFYYGYYLPVTEGSDCFTLSVSDTVYTENANYNGNVSAVYEEPIVGVPYWNLDISGSDRSPVLDSSWNVGASQIPPKPLNRNFLYIIA